MADVKITEAPAGSIPWISLTKADGLTYLDPSAPVDANLIRLWPTSARLIKVIDSTGTKTLVDTDSTQTLSGKTLTSPTISGGTINNAVIGGLTPVAGTFTTLTANTSLTTPIWKPSADSTTALKITKADGATAIITIDTTNGVIGIGTTAVTPNLINAAVAPSDGTVSNIVFNASHSLTSNADTTASQRVLNFVATMAGSGGASTGGLIGIIGDVRNNQTAGIWGSIEGFNATIRNQNASTLALARAFDAIQIISGAGSVTTSDLFVARSPSLTSSGGMTTHRGFHANNLGNSLITTSIAFHADTQSGSTNNICVMLGTTAPTGNWAIHATTTSDSALAGKLMIGSTTAPTTTFHVITSDSGTNAVVNVETITHNSNGAIAANFGVGSLWAGQDSTTANVEFGRIRWFWTTATHASRKARGVLSAYDTAERDCVFWEASGTAPMLSFFSVTTPIVQPTTAIAAATFVANTSGIVNDTATFDGYTIGQMAKVLRNLGLAA